MTVKKADEKKKCKCLCCCCCRRQSSESLDRDHNRNGTRLAHHSETVPALGDEKATNSLTFQHDSSKDTSPKEKNARKKCQTTCVKCCKKFLTFLFSNIGLCSVVVAYSILGGFIFQELEAPNEIRKRHFVASMRSKMAFDIWNLTQTVMILHEQNFTRITERILVQFQTELLDAKKTGWDGNDGSVDPQWSFAGSLLYSVTVITTIGKPVPTFLSCKIMVNITFKLQHLLIWEVLYKQNPAEDNALIFAACK